MISTVHAQTSVQGPVLNSREQAFGISVESKPLASGLLIWHFLVQELLGVHRDAENLLTILPSALPVGA